MSNFISDNLFVGVVEDRMDPMKLGRAKVRIFGLHTHDKSLLSTDDLPWAYKIQPSTSGAISGIGHAPVGVMEGTWVAIQFIDPDKQMPFIIGTLAGIPQSNNPDLEIFTLGIRNQQPAQNNLTTEDGIPITDGSGNPIQTGEPEGTTEPKRVVDWKERVTRRLGMLESTNNYRAINQLNFIGKYQFGAAALIDRGYVRAGSRNRDLPNPASWTGKNGIRSQDDFLGNKAIQEQVMSEHIDANYRIMKRIGIPMGELSDPEKAGFVATAHLLGPGGARQLYRGINGKDANGMSGKRYYEEGYASVAGNIPGNIPRKDGITTPDQIAQRNARAIKSEPSIEVEPSDDTSSTIGGRVQRRRFKGSGFQDPMGRYPLQTHLDEPDTNRLARHEKIGETIVYSKEQSRHTGIQKANNTGQWDQTNIPYNARYPFNNVWQSESGHVLEFDDTEGNERLHLYHPAGTFTEIDHNGSHVKFVVGDDYTIIERNGFVHITGAQHVKIDGAKTLLVDGSTDIQVNGPATINLHSNAKINIANNLDFTVGGNFNLKVGGNLNMYSGGNTGIDTGGVIHLNGGIASSLAGMPTIPIIESIGSEIDPLKVNTRAETTAINYEVDPEDAAEYAVFFEKALESGILTEEQLAAEPESDEFVTVNPNTLEGEKMDPITETQFDLDTRISRHYRLRDLTNNRPIRPNVGLTETQIFNNLRALAVNVLDPLKDRYSNMRINSGLRANTNSSQHNRGEAVDISFPDVSRRDLFDRIQLVETMVPYDQMILEYLTPGGNGWIHISYRNTGNRKQVFTMNNHRRVGSMGNFHRIIT